MFQTEPILFLQSRGGELLDALMIGVSLCGYPAFYVVALSVIVFAVDFRRGFVLLQALLWTAAVTELLKNAFALPRPYDADSRVLDVTRGRRVRSEFLAMGGAGFWDLPQEAAVAWVRSQADWSYGLPSGHVSGCAAFTGGLALLWESRRGAVAACVAVVVMALSRVYLGRHFFADVLGGALLGALALGVLAVWLRGPRSAARLPATARQAASPLAVAALLVPPLVFAALRLPADAAGLMFGINLGFLAVGRRGFPRDAGSWWHRTARALVALTLVAATGATVRWLAPALGAPRGTFAVDFVTGLAPGLALIWGTTALALRAGLYTSRHDNADIE